MNLNDYIFERHLDEWLNIQDEINEKSYSYGKSTGFWGWLKDLGKKFWEWLTGKDYDDDDDWSWDRKSKGIDLNNDKLQQFFKSNAVLQKKFPTSYKLTQLKNFDGLGAITVMNSNKTFSACITFTTEEDEMLKLLEAAFKNNVKWKKQIYNFLDPLLNDNEIVYIINIEFAQGIDNTDLGPGIFKEIHKAFVDFDYICYMVHPGFVMEDLFKGFINNDGVKKIKYNDVNTILFSPDDIKKYSKATVGKSPSETVNKKDKDNDKEKTNDTPPPLPSVDDAKMKITDDTDKEKENIKDEEPEEKTDEKPDEEPEEKSDKEPKEDTETTNNKIEFIDTDKNDVVASADIQTDKEIIKKTLGFKTNDKEYYNFLITDLNINEKYINDNEDAYETLIDKYILPVICDKIEEKIKNKDINKPIKIYIKLDDEKYKKHIDALSKLSLKKKLKKGDNEIFIIIGAKPEDMENTDNKVEKLSKEKNLKKNESFMSLSKYIKSSMIYESLDENMFYLLDTWFYGKDEEKNNFLNIINICTASKSYTKDTVKELCNQYNIDVKPLVSFIHQEINNDPNKEIDYDYNMKLIIDAIIGNKSKSNTYVKNTYNITEN